MATVAPSSASNLATASPIPELPPVTSARLPESFRSMLSLERCAVPMLGNQAVFQAPHVKPVGHVGFTGLVGMRYPPRQHHYDVVALGHEERLASGHHVFTSTLRGLGLGKLDDGLAPRRDIRVVLDVGGRH